MATTYQNITKAALMNWKRLSEEEANLKIQNESTAELDNQVYALGSVKHAVVGIARQLGLNAETEKAAGFTEIKCFSRDS